MEVKSGMEGKEMFKCEYGKMPKKHHPVKKQWAKKNISFLSFSFSPLPPFLLLALSPTLPAPSLPLFLSLLPLDIDQLPDPQLHGQMDGFCI